MRDDDNEPTGRWLTVKDYLASIPFLTYSNLRDVSKPRLVQIACTLRYIAEELDEIVDAEEKD